MWRNKATTALGEYGRRRSPRRPTPRLTPPPPTAMRRMLAESRRSELGSSDAHTIPFLNSSSGYRVPRQMMPSFHSAWHMESSKVYTKSIVLTGCSRK
jgi:hypothetical protein